MKLLEKHFEIALETPDGITRLRQLILKLAFQGKLVRQNSGEISIKKYIENKITTKIDKKAIDIDSIKKPFKIPKNWKWYRLGDIGDTNIGLTYSPKDITNEGIIVLRSSNVQNGKIDLKDLVRVDKIIKDNLIVKDNDILICARNGSKALVGKAAIIRDLSETMTFGAFMAIYRTEFYSYVYQFLQAPMFRESLENVSTTTINQITQNDLKNTIIPLPPLEEQKRIVEKIDQLMLLCDKLEEERNGKDKLKLKINAAAINNLIKANDDVSFNSAWSFIANQFDTLYSVKQNVTVLKDAILNLAIKGKLISENLKNKVLINTEIDIVSSIKFKINEKDYPFSLPKDWKWIALNDLGLTQTGTTPATKNLEYYGDYMPFIGPGDIKNQMINYTNLSLSELGLEKARLIPSHSVMMVCIGGSIGKLAINDRDVTCNQQINTITPYSNVDLKYLFSVLQSSYFQNQIISNSSGSATPIINKQKWVSIPIPVPPYEVQKVISNKVDELFKLCDMLEKNIEQSSQKQSQILNAVLAQV